jgi:hypothetical protein
LGGQHARQDGWCGARLVAERDGGANGAMQCGSGGSIMSSVGGYHGESMNQAGQGGKARKKRDVWRPHEGSCSILIA